ncbi:MAG: hypothetical protein FWG83_08290, partial [Oscillospiraceae bacterium]|nr:hypothetical protein [Oscillospiraceae bacterium]
SGSIISDNETAFVGGITGFMGRTSNSPEIVNCRNTATILATSSGVSGAGMARGGGIAGRMDDGRIFNSHNNGEVTGSGAYPSAGGIVGEIRNDAKVDQSGNTGKVTLTSNSWQGWVGGITGMVEAMRGIVTSSFNTGDIVLDGNTTATNPQYQAGGIVGNNRGTISDTYNRGNVTVIGTGSEAFAGGIVGNAGTSGSSSPSVVTRSYSTGNVTCGTNLGGVAGNVLANNATVTDTFWNNEAIQKVGSIELPAATRRGIGNGTGSAVGLSSSQMRLQASFTGFDFDEVWAISSSQNDGYPTLRTTLPRYNVTMLRGTGGSGSNPGVIGSYLKGETVSITAPAPSSANNRFVKWTTTSDDVVFADETNMETTFVMLGKNVTVTATYESVPYQTVSVVSGTGGGSRREGSTVSISASTAPSGKEFKEWIADGDDVVFADKNSRSTTFVMPRRAVTVTATYQDIGAVNCNLGGSCGKNPCQTPAVCDPCNACTGTCGQICDNKAHCTKIFRCLICEDCLSETPCDCGECGCEDCFIDGKCGICEDCLSGSSHSFEIVKQDKKIGNVDIFEGSIVIEDVEQSGELTIPWSELNNIKLDNMWLFKVNGNKVSEGAKPTINIDGSITATVESGSTYVLQRIQPGSIKGKGKVTGNRNDISISDALHTLMAVAKMPSSDAYGDADARCVRAAKVNNPDANDIVIADALQVLMFVARMSSSRVVLLQK